MAQTEKMNIPSMFLLLSIFFLKIATLVNSLPISKIGSLNQSSVTSWGDIARLLDNYDDVSDPNEYIIIFEGYTSDLMAMHSLFPHREYFRNLFNQKTYHTSGSRKVNHHVKRGAPRRFRSRVSCQRRRASSGVLNCKIRTCLSGLPLDRISLNSHGFGCSTKRFRATA